MSTNKMKNTATFFLLLLFVAIAISTPTLSNTHPYEDDDQEHEEKEMLVGEKSPHRWLSEKSWCTHCDNDYLPIKKRKLPSPPRKRRSPSPPPSILKPANAPKGPPKYVRFAPEPPRRFDLNRKPYDY
ncbi:hypothetical protein CASFOL_029967 [Castilleja foliolosa]|uniref:Uncharacterized protein n=1 Tax=Castilleja foliolosa TaxID=1961234 RepID=A0ABD3CA11_9LAMI